MIELSDDRARLDIDCVHRWLASSYWTPGIARETVERAIAGSHPLGAYRGAEQIGFARAITDGVSFAWIDDVWVAEGERGHGIGRRLVGWFADQPAFATVRRMLLVTRDAHGVYAGVGFTPLLRPERYMERLSPSLAAALRATP